MIAWAVDTAIAVSVLIVGVLLIRRPFAAAFGARAAYALWLAPALRAVTPPLAIAPVSMPAGSLAGSADYVLLTQSSTAWAWPYISALLVAAWIGGTVTFLALHLWRHHRFIRGAMASGRALNVPGVDYDVVASERVDGPMATGLMHPLILVPADFERAMSVEEQRFALWHEQLHHRRGDIWASAGALVLVSLLWFNPFAHLALGAFRRDMEAACDARLLDEAGASAAPAYAATILRCAARPVPRSLCALTAIDELKGRLMMLKLNHGPVRRVAGLLLASAVAFGGMATASAAAQDKTREATEVVQKKVVIMHGDKEALKRGELSPELRKNIDEKIAKCDGQAVEANANTEANGKYQKTKIVLCGKGDPKEVADKLEKALPRIEAESELSPEAKAKLLAELRTKIAELRAAH